jgi:hypothetical protein
MDIDEEHIWYVCYGSNLSKQRFMCYIADGIPRYAICKSKADGPCKNTTLLRPDDVEHITIDYPLYFNGNSRSWADKCECGAGNILTLFYRVFCNLH